MSKLTIRNLEDARDLDRAACSDVQGGMQVPELPLEGLRSLLANVNSATISQNPVNIVMSGSGGSGDTVNYLGNASITPVNVSSPVTVVQGGLPA